LYRQHGEAPLADSARARFAHIGDHVLLPAAGAIAAADDRLAERAREAVARAAALVPDGWLGADGARSAGGASGAPSASGSPPAGAAARRADLVAFLLARLEPPRDFVEEAERARP
jgi:hypothetical protein